VKASEKGRKGVGEKGRWGEREWGRRGDGEMGRLWFGCCALEIMTK